MKARCWKCEGVGGKVIPPSQHISGKTHVILCPVCQGDGEIKKQISTANMIKDAEKEEKLCQPI